MPPHLHHIRGTTLERAPADAEEFGGFGALLAAADAGDILSGASPHFSAVCASI